MKQFLITVATVVITLVIGLFAYEKLIVEPRIQKEQNVTAAELATLKTTASAVRDAAMKDMTAAKAATAELDQSVKSATSAQAALDAQAAARMRRSLIASAVASATMFKVAVTEFAQTEGRLPDNGTQIGLDKPESYANGAVKAISLGAKGVITITLNEKLEQNASIKLTPTWSEQSGTIKWECTGTVQGLAEVCK